MLHRVTHGRLQHEMLVRASKSEKPGRKAIDATAGMGEDGFLLAAQGYEVTLYEQNPVIAVLLKDALRRAKKHPVLKEIAARMKLEPPCSQETDLFDAAISADPDKIIVNDFSADVHDGQKIAIVGPTGAGKTTMVKLLMRFYDVNGGSIKVDGHDVRNFNRSNLREMFGMVLQDTWLFSGTIMENIRYGRLDATDEEVIAAAKAAHIHNFIMQQPGGYQMVLDEETSNVSQGQKQLLTIARAILADNKILILDEATSSVDTRTEMQIQKAMDNLMKGRTSFVIAHRLSTIRDADNIIVMDHGDIVEVGSHDELMKRNGFYTKLYNAQFEEA